MPTFYRRKRKIQIQAGLFGLSLILLMLFSLSMAFASLNSVVLGTELNPNGTVEYLCLGTGCENLTAMDW